jgi:hypothetical protein
MSLASDERYQWAYFHWMYSLIVTKAFREPWLASYHWINSWINTVCICLLLSSFGLFQTLLCNVNLDEAKVNCPFSLFGGSDPRLSLSGFNILLLRSLSDSVACLILGLKQSFQSFWYENVWRADCSLKLLDYYFSSIAHVWVPGAKTTGLIAQHFFSS